MPHIVFNTADVSISDLISQYGGGQYFVGTPWQRGGGIGDTLRRFWRYLMPIVKPIAKEIGREGLAAGSRILGSVADGQPLSDVMVNEGRASVRNLARRVQQGEGKRRRRRNNVILHPSDLEGRLCCSKVPIKKPRKDALGLY